MFTFRTSATSTDTVGMASRSRDGFGSTCAVAQARPQHRERCAGVVADQRLDTVAAGQHNRLARAVCRANQSGEQVDRHRRHVGRGTREHRRGARAHRPDRRAGPESGVLSGSATRGAGGLPPCATTGCAPAAVKASATHSASGRPTSSRLALSLPMRVEAPPHSTTPAGLTPEATHRSGGSPPGSSWTRNPAHLSASSSSPMAAAERPRPSSDHKKPWLVGSAQRT